MCGNLACDDCKMSIEINAWVGLCADHYKKKEHSGVFKAFC